MPDLDFTITRRPFDPNELQLHAAAIVNECGERLVYLAQPTKLELLKEEDLLVEERDPLLTMPMGSGQKLMDELWRAGLRPTEGTGSAGALAATQAHIQDLRAIVFKGEVKPTQQHPYTLGR